MTQRSPLVLDARKIREIEHSNHRRSIVKGYEYRTDTADDQCIERFIEGSDEYARHFSNMKYYSITQASSVYRDLLLNENIVGSVTLDYCCGNGEVAIEMAKRGAKKVIGIDISEVAIQNAQQLARFQGVSGICEFRVMDAEHTEFEGNSFDIIHEYGALHHLELKAAFAELSRILKPDGKLVCTEAMRHNPIIHWYRKKTPHLRTQWEVEHILGVPEINSGGEFFSAIDMRMFHFAALAAVMFRRTYLFRPLLASLNMIDNVILSIPFLNRLAWVAVVEYRNPRKPVK
jgi:ubiquinone/menaquinone biosynthesis C-methylase UbiE